MRARINVLSEIPSEWNEHLERWSTLNAEHKQRFNGHSAPDRNEEYFLYQTLLGAWPLEPPAHDTVLERVQDHLIKATREAMVHTRWTRPNQPHEDALKEFAARILSAENRQFLEDFGQFRRKIAYYGMINSLSQALVKIAAPGVADFYQGSELWDLRLVDPDNRGPVDFQKRSAVFQQIQNPGKSKDGLRDLLHNWPDGSVKMYLIWKALCFRREHVDLFQQGEMVPLQPAGCHSENVVAFMRRTANSSVLVAVPRWMSNLRGKHEGETINFDWCDTCVLLPPGSPQRWKNILAPAELRASYRDGNPSVMAQDLFEEFPVALLQSS